MPNLKRSYPFEPSKESKLKWLSTRKNLFQINSITLPGLFSTSQYPKDRLGFFAVIILETIGIGYIFFEGYKIVYCIGIFLIDFLLAYLFRLQEGRIRTIENEKIDYKAIDRSDFKAFNKPPEKEDKWIILKCIFGVLLFFIAISKIMIVCFIKSRTIDYILIIVILSYLLVVYLQLKHTGYFLLELRVKFHFDRDYKKFIQLKEEGQNKYWIQDYRNFPFYSSIALTSSSIGKRHFLEKIDPNKVDGKNYQFRTWGILTDEDLIFFSFYQRSSEAIYIVTINGHKHQMQILNHDAQSKEINSKDVLIKDDKNQGLLKKEKCIKSILKEYIRNNKTTTALEKLILFLSNSKNDPELLNIILNLQSQLNKLTNDSRKGVIVYEEELRIRARINSAVIEIINELH